MRGSAHNDGTVTHDGKGFAKCMSDSDRFMLKVSVSDDGCWIWTSKVDREGYGVFQMNGRSWRATHAALLLLRGVEKPAGAVACHSCDRTSCVNPEHLWYGTQAQNIADRDAKGHTFRGPNPKLQGEAMARSKLKVEQVLTIRHLRNVIGMTAPEIAAIYGISPPTVYGIASGKTWRHVP